MPHYSPDSLRTDKTTPATGKSVLAIATLVVGVVLNVTWIGLIIVVLLGFAGTTILFTGLATGLALLVVWKALLRYVL